MSKKNKILCLLTTLTLTPSMVLLSSCGQKKSPSTSSPNTSSEMNVTSSLISSEEESSSTSTSSVHVHNPKSTWTFTSTHHYHECEGCEEKLDYTEHTFDEGKILKDATFKENGYKKFTCKCGYSKTEEIVFTDITSVNFQKNIDTLDYTIIEITEDNLGTHYFQYNVTDCEDTKSEYYWINVTKTSLTNTDVTDCKIYDENKVVIKDSVDIMAAGQFMATREGTGEGFDDHDTILKLKQEGIHYFELTFNTVGTYKIHVTHYGSIGKSKKWAFSTKYNSTSISLQSEKNSYNTSSSYWFKVELTQEMIADICPEDPANFAELDGAFYDSSNNSIDKVSIKVYDINGSELENESGYAPRTFAVCSLYPGTYYVVATFSATCYGYLDISLC